MRKVLFEAVGVEGVYRAIGNARKVAGTDLVGRQVIYACIIENSKTSNVLQAVCKLADAGCDLDNSFSFFLEAFLLPGAGLRGGSRLCIHVTLRQRKKKTDPETAWVTEQI